MNLFGIGTGELLLILAIILLVMGPERLPQIARYWGRLVRTAQHFTRVWQNFSAELTRELELEDQARREAPRPRPSSQPADSVQPTADDGVETAEEPTRTIAPPRAPSLGDEPATEAAAQAPGQNGSQVGEPATPPQKDTEAAQSQSSNPAVPRSPAEEENPGEVADG
jgi:Tat protein translocase TatB subunit